MSIPQALQYEFAEETGMTRLSLPRAFRLMMNRSTKEHLFFGINPQKFQDKRPKKAYR